MECTSERGLEFLDLTDVDECEKHRVLSSLKPVQSNVRLPWYIGDGKVNVKGTKPTKFAAAILPQSVVNSPSYEPVTVTQKTPVIVINPENGLVVPLTSKSQSSSILAFQPQNGLGSQSQNSSVGNVNGPSSKLTNEFYDTPSQYYPSSPQVAAISSLPAPPTSYEDSPKSTSQPDVLTNNAIYPAFIPPAHSVKPVYYGVPPSQSIFGTHPSTIDTASFYQTISAPYVQGITPLETKSVSPQDNILVENKWNVQADHVTECAQANSLPPQVIFTKKAGSPLSADSPAFTPRSHQNLAHKIEDFSKAREIGEIQTSVNDSGPKQDIVSTAQNTQELTAQVNPQTCSVKQSGPWGAGKSWASLFTSKEGRLCDPTVNGFTKSAFAEIVNKNCDSSELVSCPFRNPKKNYFIDPDCYRMGEYLSSYAVDGRTVSVQPRGLINQSNYCYINSILQALIACPPMYNLLYGLADNISSNARRKPTPVIDGMCKFVKEYKHLPANMRVNNRRSESNKKEAKKDQSTLINTDIPFEPSWIYKILHGLQTDLMEGRQEDAEEFLGCLLNHLSDEMLELIKLVNPTEKPQDASSHDDEDDDSWQVMGNKNKGSVLRKTEFERTPITDIFGGSLKSRIYRIGGTVSENTQPFLTLPLNIEKVNTVREALEALTTKYQLEGLTTSKNEEVEAWQQVMLDELPVVLVLHLKCFDFKLDGCTKIVKALEFPIDLKIDAKLLSTKTTNAKEKQYKLFAVVYHDGKEATKGHYITDTFHVGYSSWLRYDDASVKPVQEEQVLNPQGTRVPYLLFYRRSDTIRSR